MKNQLDRKEFIKRTALAGAGFVVLPHSISKRKKQVATIEKPVLSSDWTHIFNPNDTRSEIATNWYTNDHCFAHGPDGKWHAYGIIGHKPIDPWTGETKLFHVSADSFDRNQWEDHGYALEVKPGVERVLWAPHIYHEKGGEMWHMFYNIGNMQEHAPDYASWGQLCRADSRDMFNWKRHDLNPIFSDPPCQGCVRYEGGESLPFLLHTSR